VRFVPTLTELRQQARQKREEVIVIRRQAASLSLAKHRQAFLADAARLEMEADALEAEVAKLEGRTAKESE